MPINNGTLVSSLLQRLVIAPGTVPEGETKTIDELLTYNYEISTPSREFLAAIERQAEDDFFSNVMSNGDKEALADYLWSKDTLDLLNLNPFTFFPSLFNIKTSLP